MAELLAGECKESPIDEVQQDRLVLGTAVENIPFRMAKNKRI